MGREVSEGEIEAALAVLAAAEGEAVAGAVRGVAAVLEGVEDDACADALARVAGRAGDGRAEVRLAVAEALATRAAAVEVVVGLSADADDGVRLAATAGLGRGGVETAAVRAALAARRADGVEAVRREAEWGLVERWDVEAIEWLAARVGTAAWGAGDEAAARCVCRVAGEDAAGWAAALAEAERRAVVRAEDEARWAAEKAWWVRLEAEGHGVEALFEFALSDEDEARARAAVIVLHLHPSAEDGIFERAAALAGSSVASERAVGLGVLQQYGCKLDMGVQRRPERLVIGLGCLDDEDPAVVADAIYVVMWTAMHDGAPEAPIARVAALWRHADAGVRYAVAAVVGDYVTPAAVEAVVRLTEDSDDEVRERATFELGYGEADSPAVRAALRARLGDPLEDARLEAWWGLAKRRAPDALRWLAQRLEAGVDCHRDHTVLGELWDIVPASVEAQVAAVRAEADRVDGAG